MRAATLGLALAAALWSGAAGARPLAQVRVSSLRAALADAGTVAAAAGQTARAEDLLLGLLAPYGVGDLSLLDADRPVAAVLPLEGMMLQQRGVVVALPVPAAGPLYDAVAGNFAARSVEGDLQVFSDAAGPVVYARELGGYVIAGQTPALVSGFDPATLAAPGDGPPGSIVADLDLEPLAPLLQAGLIGARENLRQQLSHPAPGREDRPPVDGAALAGMLDLYLDAVQGVLADLSRIQWGLEIRGDHLFWHNRVEPRPGTATAEFLAGQGGGLPPLSRVVEPGAVSFAGQVTVTPRLRAAAGVFLARYVELTGRLWQPPAAAAGQGDPAAYFTDLGALLQQSLDCYTGAAAGAVGFSSPGGLELAEVVGTVDTPECRDLTRRALAAVGSLPREEGVPVPSISSARETVGGVVTDRIEVDMGPAAAGLDEDAERLLELVYGGPVVTSYVASSGELLYYALGGNARDAMAKLLGAAAAPAGQGITAATLAPLVPGPGLFFSLELPQLLAFAREAAPPDDPGRARLDQAAQLFQGGDPSAGRLAAGVALAPRGATFQLALPLRALAARGLMPAPAGTPAAAGAAPAAGPDVAPASRK